MVCMLVLSSFPCLAGVKWHNWNTEGSSLLLFTPHSSGCLYVLEFIFKKFDLFSLNGLALQYVS